MHIAISLSIFLYNMTIHYLESSYKFNQRNTITNLIVLFQNLIVNFIVSIHS